MPSDNDCGTPHGLAAFVVDASTLLVLVLRAIVKTCG